MRSVLALRFIFNLVAQFFHVLAKALCRIAAGGNCRTKCGADEEERETSGAGVHPMRLRGEPRWDNGVKKVCANIGSDRSCLRRIWTNAISRARDRNLARARTVDYEHDQEHVHEDYIRLRLPRCAYWRAGPVTPYLPNPFRRRLRVRGGMLPAPFSLLR